MMKRSVLYNIGIVILLVMTGCEHRPLVDLNSNHYIRVYIDEQIKNVTYGFYDESREKPEYNQPNVIRVALHHPETDQVVAERYLQNSGTDERGYYLDGYIQANPGKYNVMVYNFGTESTQIKEEQSYWGMTAYTNTIANHLYGFLPKARQEYADSKIVYEPDHLFIDNIGQLEIKQGARTDTLYNSQGSHFHGQSMVETYYLQVRVKGIQWATSGVSLMSNLAGSKRMHNRQMVEEDSVLLFMDLKVAERDKEKDEAILYTTFNTFGKLPGKQTLFEVNFEFITVDGRSQLFTFDITPKFETEQVKKERWILLDEIIEIEPPPSVGDGGFQPGVDDWKDIWTDIII